MKMCKNAVIGLCLLLAGCGENQPNGSGGKVYATVGDWQLTEQIVKDEVVFRAKVQELAGRRLPTGYGYARWANQLASQLIPGLVNWQLWENELKRSGVVADAEDKAKLFENFKRVTRQRVKTVEELADKFGDQREMFWRQFERESLMIAYMRKVLAVKVEDYEVDTYIDAMKKLVAWGKKENADARKRANEAWEKLNAGEDWETVAVAYDQSALINEQKQIYWREWMSFFPKDAPYDELKALLPLVRKGGYTRPFETDEGLQIVKVVDIEKGFYTCVRIMVRMAMAMSVPTREKAKDEIYRDKLKDMQAQTLERLRSESKIDFPQGTNVTCTIWSN